MGIRDACCTSIHRLGIRGARRDCRLSLNCGLFLHLTGDFVPIYATEGSILALESDPDASIHDFHRGLADQIPSYLAFYTLQA